MIKFSKAGYIFPNGAIVCMKDMQAVHMDLDASLFFAVYITRDVGSLVDSHAFLAGFCHTFSKHCAEQARTYNEIVIFSINLSRAFPFIASIMAGQLN